MSATFFMPMISTTGDAPNRAFRKSRKTAVDWLFFSGLLLFFGVFYRTVVDEVRFLSRRVYILLFAYKPSEEWKTVTFVWEHEAPLGFDPSAVELIKIGMNPTTPGIRYRGPQPEGASCR